MRRYGINRIVICIGLIMASVFCTGTPAMTRQAQTADTVETSVTNTMPMNTRVPDSSPTPTLPPSPAIMPTSTNVPDVELAQLQIGSGQTGQYFAEIVNHLNMPVVFEDQKPAFRFDIYDPLADKHFLGEEMINRKEFYSPIPCVIYPGETVFFIGLVDTWKKWWEGSGNKSKEELLQITYQSLGVPRPDWKENGTHYKIRDLTWHVDGGVLYFSLRYDPLHRGEITHEYFFTTIGLYDKDNRLLGVAEAYTGTDSGTMDNYRVSLDYHSSGIGGQGFMLIGVRDIKERFDHIKIIIEVFPEFDGFCQKMP